MRFGASLAALGNHLVVGADGYDVPGAANSGAAFLYDADASSPTFGAFVFSLARAFAAPGDRFCAAVAVRGDEVIVGAPGTPAAAGTAAVFGGRTRSASTPPRSLRTARSRRRAR